MSAIVSPILNAGIRFWAIGAFYWLFLVLTRYAYWFIRCRDVGPPRVRIDSVSYLALMMVAAGFQAWAVSLIGFVAFLASIWLGSRALRKDWASEEHLKRDSGDRTVLILPDLSRRLAGDHPLLLLPRVCLDHLRDAEVEALLARQAAPQSNWRLLLALVILSLGLVWGSWAAPRCLAPLISIASMLCIWALMVCVYRRLDAQADTKAIQATGDPATFIQAITKADRLMQEIPPRHRMSTWWLFPASLQSRIAAINLHAPEVLQK